METANSSVFRGIEGTGDAVILAQPSNYLATYQQAIQQRKADEAAKAKAAAEAKKKRDETISELLEFAPDKAWEPFDSQLKETVDREIRQFVLKEAVQKGRDVHDPTFQAEYQRRADIVNLISSKSNHLKSQFEEITKNYSEGDNAKYYHKSYYDRLRNDIFFNEDGSAKSLAEIKSREATYILDDHKGYNIEAIASDIVKELPKKLIADYEKNYDGDVGFHFDKKEFASKIYQRNADGSIKIDPKTGNEMLNFIPEVYRAVMGNPLFKNWVEGTLKEQGIENPTEEQKMALAEQRLQGHDEISRKTTPTGVTKYDKEDKYGGSGYTKPPKLVDTRYKTLREAIYNFDLSALKQATKADKGINVRYLGRDLGPGQKEIARGTLSNDPTHIEITVNKTQAKKLGLLTDESEYVNNRVKLQPIPISTDEEKEAALFVLNDLLDLGLPSNMTIGNDNITIAHDKYLKDNAPSTGGVYDTDESDTGGVY